jgi:N utilization substance protein B
MPRTRVETKARARALQALYAYDMRGVGRLESAAARLWDDLAVPAPERAVATRLVAALARNGADIDRALSDVTENWRLERLGAIERALLRLGAAELIGTTTPVKVVIQEHVRLAERFAGAQSARFVNGVLDALARRMGRL